MIAHTPPPPAPPIGLLVELTHRCPLGCLYCSNPVALERPGNELDGETWKRVFSEAVALIDPVARQVLDEINAHLLLDTGTVTGELLVIRHSG